MKVIDKKFYHLFWTDKTCQDIFAVHRTQLLEDEVELIVTREKFFAQRLVLTNSQKRKSGTKLAKRTENESIEVIHNLQNAISKYFDEERIETVIKNKFGKTIKKIETDFSKSGGWLKLLLKIISSLESEEDLFKLLSDYHLTPKEITTKEQFFKYAETEFTTHLKKFVKNKNLSELAISIDLVSAYYNHKLKNNLVTATKHYTDILYNEDNYKNRLDFFDNLYEIEVIKGGVLKSYYECVNCPPNSYNGILTMNIKPSNLAMKCPACKKELYYIVPYELNKTIYNHIVHKDGLLFFAIEYLLERHNYKFIKNNTFPPDIELDFSLLNEDDLVYEIIEVKMFKTDRPKDTQVGNLREAVSKIKNAIKKLVKIAPNYKTIQKSIVTNLIDNIVLKTAKSELEKDLKEYNIDIYTINDFYQKVKKN